MVEFSDQFCYVFSVLWAVYVHSMLFPYITTEFHINQQRINIPLIMESLQVTELGTNVRLAVTATSLFSMRGNFTYQRSGRNCHVIIRCVRFSMLFDCCLRTEVIISELNREKKRTFRIFNSVIARVSTKKLQFLMNCE